MGRKYNKHEIDLTHCPTVTSVLSKHEKLTALGIAIKLGQDLPNVRFILYRLLLEGKIEKNGAYYSLRPRRVHTTR
jgi:hypothetical protein